MDSRGGCLLGRECPVSVELCWEGGEPWAARVVVLPAQAVDCMPLAAHGRGLRRHEPVSWVPPRPRTSCFCSCAMSVRTFLNSSARFRPQFTSHDPV